jgi:hypothetical protein
VDINKKKKAKNVAVAPSRVNEEVHDFELLEPMLNELEPLVQQIATKPKPMEKEGPRKGKKNVLNEEHNPFENCADQDINMEKPKKRVRKLTPQDLAQALNVASNQELLRPSTPKTLTSAAIPLLSDAHIARLVPLFKPDFAKCQTIAEQEKMQWTILQLIQEEFNIPQISEALRMIYNALQHKDPHATVGNYGEMDVWHAHKPKAYRLRTHSFFDEYVIAVDNEARKKLVTSFVIKMRAEGFRFLQGNPTEGGANEMPMSEAEKIVRQRMTRLKQLIMGKGASSKGVINLDDAPGPFNDLNPVDPVGVDPVGPFSDDGLPSAMSIIHGKVAEAKGRQANAAYRQKIANHASEFNTTPRDERIGVTMRVVEAFRNEGYFFVMKQDNTWNIMDHAAIVKKVKLSLKDFNAGRSGKKKTVEKDCGDDTVNP